MKTILVTGLVFLCGCSAQVALQPFTKDSETDPKVITALNAIGEAVKQIDTRLREVEKKNETVPK